MNTISAFSRSILLLAGFLATLHVAHSETRNWSARGGRPVPGELLAYDPLTKKATLKLSTGAQTVVAFDALSDADQAYLAERQRKLDESISAAKANAGKIADYQSDGPEAVSYHVYYPTNYNPSAPPAMLIMFSPGGSGKGILGSVKDACETLGWVGVGCDAFKNNADESMLDRKWRELLPHIEKTVPHNADLLYLGGMSGGGLRAYDYSESTARPWKGVLAFGGWLAGKTTLHCAPKMAVAIVNGASDKGANGNAVLDEKVLRAAHCTVKMFSFPGGHEVAPPPVVLQAMQWLKETTVPGNRMSAGKRSPTPRDPDLSKVK